MQHCTRLSGMHTGAAAAAAEVAVAAARQLTVAPGVLQTQHITLKRAFMLSGSQNR